MRVAVISDIHGNLPALEAVLSDVSRESVELIVSCGDDASGPLRVEPLQVLRGLPGARFVRGNADRALVAGFDGSQMPRLKGPSFDWCSSQLTRQDRDFLASFVETIVIEVDGLGRVLFCHGSPPGGQAIMIAPTGKSRPTGFPAGRDADVLVCGPTQTTVVPMQGRVLL